MWVGGNEMCTYKHVLNNVKKNSEVVPHHAMKAYGGTRCIVPLILYLSTGWRVSGQLHTSAAVPPLKTLVHTD
jgi:hypothetical protein